MAASFTIGIEEEFQMVDRQTGQLCPRIHTILEKGHSIFGEQIKAEMLQSMVEINSDIMPDIPTAREEMRTMRAKLNASKKGVRRCARIRGGKVEDGRKEIQLTKPLTLPPLNEEALTELRRRYEESPDAETRTRYQMLLLSLRGQKSKQIAHTVLRSQDTVERVLKRFLAGGLDAVPRRTAPGRARTVTAAWEAELLRVIELDPHEVGQDTANWTTERLADYLGQHTGVQVTEETVRVYLHAHDYVCKRPTWTLRRKAEQKVDYVGNACG
jgi:transposase